MLAARNQICIHPEKQAEAHPMSRSLMEASPPDRRNWLCDKSIIREGSLVPYS